MVFIEFHLGNMHYARAPYYHASNNQDTSTCNSSFAPFLAPNFKVGELRWLITSQKD